MRIKELRTLTLEDIQRTFAHKVFYTGDVLVVRKIKEEIALSSDQIMLECMLLVCCSRGTLRFNINHSEYTIKGDEYAILLPGTVISPITPATKQSSDVYILAFSTSIFQRTLHNKSEVWQMIQALRNNPIIFIGRERNISITHYNNLLRSVIARKDSYYKNETVNHIFSALLCDILSSMKQYLANSLNEPSKAEVQSYVLFERFMRLVVADGGVHRSVAFYANELCCTPTSLNKHISLLSGKTPNKIIHSIAIECIKEYLKNSSMSIKEIAEELQFPNPSFFGTYVKRHLGMTPMQYREMFA